MIKSISIQGLRGFASQCVVDFSLPNGELGSGLTILVGANNSGKTTILEALRSFNCDENNKPSFSEGKRNKACGDTVNLIMKTDDNSFCSIQSESCGGSNTVINIDSNSEPRDHMQRIFVLQSRRYVEYEFYRDQSDRNTFLLNQQMNAFNRTPNITNFNSRLFMMQENKNEFDKLLQKVLGNKLEWHIDQHDNGSYFIKIHQESVEHTSEGLGDGVWSIFTICDALYDSEQGSVIAIDEPELSLHPAYQKKVMRLLEEYARDRQIIISTHSPYYIDFNAIINGASLYRTVKKHNNDISLFSLSDESREKLKGFLLDFNQPHTLGIEAKEIFFLEDGIIVAEGQEDVIIYQKAAEQLGMELKGTFFGWGSGGASKIPSILKILNDLGFEKVVAIFDGDEEAEEEKTKDLFPNYPCFILPANDIRDKPKIEKPFKEGCMTEKGILKEEYKEEMKQLISMINSCLNN